MVQTLILLIISITVISYLLTALIRSYALQKSILDVPNSRSSHLQPVPRGGGLAIAGVTILGLLVYGSVFLSENQLPLFMVLAGSTLIVVVGGLDDLRSLSNHVRFLAQCVAAFLIIWALGFWRVVYLPFVGYVDLGWWGLPITGLWIVGLTNAYNFMDGIDGISGSQAVMAGLGWAVLGSLNDQVFVSVLGLALAASSLGFLRHNWPPARIFMGDVGSTFLGYTFAVLPIIAATEKNSHLALAGILLVWPFVFDPAFTIFRRFLNGENVFSAHRSHLYQRLVIAGRSHRFVTLLYTNLALVGIFLALIWNKDLGRSSFLIVLSVPMLCLLLWFFVYEQEHQRAIRPDSRRPSRTSVS